LDGITPQTDGLHRLTIEVNPQGLGPVQISAEVSDGDLHVQLSGSSEAARAALRAALPDLQRELSTTAFAQTSVDVRADAGPGQQRPGAGDTSDAAGGRGQRSAGGGEPGEKGPDRRNLFAAEDQRDARRAAVAAAAGRLDLRA
ncbi:hypothetical protein GTR02_20030, partial [Kineococcus sp. R8]|uniref:flagellar hook-length control protein FliK n=1 Tax=Kineococcus siccus TaxID=2696567 RepID=UPI001412ABFA